MKLLRTGGAFEQLRDALFILVLDHAFGDEQREAADRRRLEEAAQRQFHSKLLTQARRHHRREQRVSAELEEVIVHTNRLNPEQLLPRARQVFLELVTRSGIRLQQVGSRVKVRKRFHFLRDYGSLRIRKHHPAIESRVKV